MNAAKQDQWSPRKFDGYSVMVTLVAIAALLSAGRLLATQRYVSAPRSLTAPITLPAICNCPNIPAGSNPSDYCHC